MKVPSEFLFELVNSLTPSEKVYFSKFSSRHVIGDENNYIKLFNEINKQPFYDEKALLKKFAEEKFIKQFSAAKNYLINEILRSLENYHKDDSIDSKISNLISQYVILYKKTLFKHSEVILKRAKNLATETERYVKLVEIINYEKNFDYMKFGNPEFDKLSKQRADEEKDVLRKLENISEYNLLYVKFSSIYKKLGVSRDRKDVLKYSSVMKNKLMKSESNALSVRAKNLFYIINYMYNYSTGDSKSAFEFGMKRLKLVESNPQKISAQKSEMIYALSDVIALSYNMGNFNLCLNYLRKLRETADQFKNLKSLSTQLEMYLRSYDVEINMYCDTGKFREGIKLIPEVEGWLEKYHNKIPSSMLLKTFYLIAYTCFGAGDYERALIWINQIINDKSSYRLDYKAFARIMNIIIHFELKNFILLEYELKSLKRFLEKRDKIFEYEKSVLQTFTKLIKIEDENDIQFELNKLKEKILNLNKDEYECKANEYLDVITWIESKLTGKSFQEITEKNSKQEFKISA